MKKIFPIMLVLMLLLWGCNKKNPNRFHLRLKAQALKMLPNPPMTAE